MFCLISIVSVVVCGQSCVFACDTLSHCFSVMCRADASMCVIRCESAVDEEVMMMVMLRMILV